MNDCAQGGRSNPAATLGLPKLVAISASRQSFERSIHRAIKSDIERLMVWYWARVPQSLKTDLSLEGRRLREARLLTVVRALASCGLPRCGHCLGSDATELCSSGANGNYRPYVLKSRGETRSVLRRYARQEVERLLVSAVLDKPLRPLLEDALDVVVADKMMPGCMLYSVTRGILQMSVEQTVRLSQDLAVLLKAAVMLAETKNRLDPRCMGIGPWLLNSVAATVLSQRQLAEVKGLASCEWPQYPDDWEELGACLRGAHPLSFRKKPGAKSII